MKKTLEYNIRYNKNDKTYYLIKTIRTKSGIAFRGIFHGSRLECTKYASDNNIILNEKIKLSL